MSAFRFWPGAWDRLDPSRRSVGVTSRGLLCWGLIHCSCEVAQVFTGTAAGEGFGCGSGVEGLCVQPIPAQGEAGAPSPAR